jgi:NAD(P)-dependent dehydrogenase (short-subunit alcohol dehydrogenase family)
MVGQRRGSIILTSSAGSLRANAGAISYSASKSAVNSLAMAAANAFTGTGVRVNAILPGLVETKMTRKVFEYARERGKEDRIGHMTPLQRAGQPHEIAAMAAFLASDDGSFVTGQCYAVDGGISSTHPHGRVPV